MATQRDAVDSTKGILQNTTRDRVHRVYQTEHYNIRIATNIQGSNATIVPNGRQTEHLSPEAFCQTDNSSPLRSYQT